MNNRTLIRPIPSCNQKRGRELSTKQYEPARKSISFRVALCDLVDHRFPSFILQLSIKILFVIFVSIISGGCRSKSVTGNSTASNANAERHVSKPEEVSVERI